MTPFAALRAPRDPDGILAETSDEELLAWSETLLDAPEPGTDAPVLRRRRRRTEPLRAPARETTQYAVSTADLLAEIEQRATDAANRLRLHARRQ